MTERNIHRRLFAAGLFVAVATAAFAGSEFLAEPTWQPVSDEAARAKLEEFLATSRIPDTRRNEIRELWQSENSDDPNANLLDRVTHCLAKADNRVADLVAYCSTNSTPGKKLPEFAWLADSETPPLIRNNLRLYLACWLVQQGYYDEALAWTDGLDTDDVVAPESLLFYRAVASHQIVHPAQADGTIAQLLQRQEHLPTRYQKLAELMKHDLSGLQDESLDHIARRMGDIRRRLAQGRPGGKAQVVEKGVIESLDKLIKQAEDQAQKQAQAAAAGAGSAPSNSPMPDSRIAELKGPGKVDRKAVGDGADWGNLNDRDREKAMQEIGREFPSHYREVIEEYFRRLAAEESSPQP